VSVIDQSCPETVIYDTIVEEDLAELTVVMTRAFDDDTRRFAGQERGGPPGYDNGDFFRNWLFGQDITAGYKFLVGDRIVGAAIVWNHADGNNVLGAFFIDPDFQGRGIGTSAWRYLESLHAGVKSWTLDTPVWATRSRTFYERKCGFRFLRQEGEFVFYRKDMAAAPG